MTAANGGRTDAGAGGAKAAAGGECTGVGAGGEKGGGERRRTGAGGCNDVEEGARLGWSAKQRSPGREDILCASGNGARRP